MKATKRIIDTSDSEIISNGERHAKRSRAKGVSIRGKIFLKMKNASHIIAVKGFTNRAPDLKPKLEPLRLQIKVQERLTRHYNLEVIVSI
jgi:hypothetical protein